MRPESAGGESSFRFLYPLAFLGAHLAFIPLLLLLLPRRVERLFPLDSTTVLSITLIVGAVTASFAHVLAGHASDRWMARYGQRRVPIAVGLALLAATYFALAAADTFALLMGAMVAFQVALNMMLAPLSALLSDHVEDRSKARTAAFLVLGLPISIAVCGPIGLAFPDDGSGAFSLVMILVLVCILPLLVFWPSPRSISTVGEARPATTTVLDVPDFRRAWIARLLVQCGAALIIFYLYVYVRELPAQAGAPAPLSSAMSLLVVVGGIAGAAAALIAGQLSDRLRRRRWPTAASAMVVAAGLLLLAAQPSWQAVLFGYALFSAGLMAFLSNDAAMVAQMLGSHPARGRWLGVMNLTNTIPAILTPTLTLLALQTASLNAVTLLLISAACAALTSAMLITRMASVP